MNFQSIFSFCLILVFGFYSCEEKTDKTSEPQWTKENSTDLNKEIAEQEIIDIALYCDRIPNSNFIETGTGLLYWVKEEGAGPIAEPGDIVQVSYVISFLDGEICYQTEKGTVKEFKVDKSEVETGIQEAIKLLREGSKAKLIISSYLGHGLTGDNNKIPPLTPLVIDIHVERTLKMR